MYLLCEDMRFKRDNKKGVDVLSWKTVDFFEHWCAIQLYVGSSIAYEIFTYLSLRKYIFLYQVEGQQN